MYLEAQKTGENSTSTYCRFDANGLQILNSSLSVCNSLGNSAEADFTGKGFFVKPDGGVLVRGTNGKSTYEVTINPNACTDEPEKTQKIFNICSVTSDGKLLKDYLYFDIAPTLPVLYVNGKILAQSLYLGEIKNGNIIDYVNDIGKKAIGGEYIDAKGIMVRNSNGDPTFAVTSNGDVTANYAHFEGSVFVNGDIEGSNIKASNVEGSIIKGAKIFAGDDYTEQDIIDAPIGTIKGATIDGSKIYATTIYGTSKEIKDNLALNSKVVYPEISGKSYKLMSGENQKFGLTLGDDKNQTVYMCLGQGTGEEVHVNDMVYGKDSLMIQKADKVASIYIVGRTCSIDLYENENIDILARNEIHIDGAKVFANEIEIVPEIKDLQRRCALLESKIEALENRPSV